LRLEENLSRLLNIDVTKKQGLAQLPVLNCDSNIYGSSGVDSSPSLQRSSESFDLLFLENDLKNITEK